MYLRDMCLGGGHYRSGEARNGPRTAARRGKSTLAMGRALQDLSASNCVYRDWAIVTPLHRAGGSLLGYRGYLSAAGTYICNYIHVPQLPTGRGGGGVT